MVHGAKDLVITLESVKETGAYFKNFHILDNNAHMIPIENQEEYVELITAFINKKWLWAMVYLSVILLWKWWFIAFRNIGFIELL